MQKKVKGARFFDDSKSLAFCQAFKPGGQVLHRTPKGKWIIYRRKAYWLIQPRKARIWLEENNYLKELEDFFGPEKEIK